MQNNLRYYYYYYYYHADASIFLQIRSPIEKSLLNAQMKSEDETKQLDSEKPVDSTDDYATMTISNRAFATLSTMADEYPVQTAVGFAL